MREFVLVRICNSYNFIRLISYLHKYCREKSELKSGGRENAAYILHFSAMGKLPQRSDKGFYDPTPTLHEKYLKKSELQFPLRRRVPFSLDTCKEWPLRATMNVHE
jgi:hypothetical protein